MNNKIRIGIVGAGGNTRGKHIPGLQAIEGVEISSVCNRSRASSEKVAKEFGIPKVYDHWWELVAADDTDAIVIGTWPYLHCPVTLAAFAAGKHVMTEARMAMNAAEAERMLEASKTHPHLIAQVVPSPFTLGVDKTIQRLMAEGYLGELLAIEVRACANQFLDRESPMTWRQDRDLSGFNVMSLGIWYEAVMRWAGTATRVMAMGKTFVKMRKDPAGVLRPVQIPEYLDVIADMACGAQAHYQISAVSGLAGGNRIVLIGSEGTLEFADGKLRGGRRSDKELKEIALRPEDAGGWRVEEEFINAIRGRELITHTTFADGVKYMRFTEAVATSLSESRMVCIE